MFAIDTGSLRSELLAVHGIGPENRGFNFTILPEINPCLSSMLTLAALSAAWVWLRQ